MNKEKEKLFDEYGDINTKLLKKYIISAIVIIFMLITLLCSFKTIRSGEVGLKVRFGKIVNTKLNEGLNLKYHILKK